jgi:hypothetical protein
MLLAGCSRTEGCCSMSNNVYSHSEVAGVQGVARPMGDVL